MNPNGIHGEYGNEIYNEYANGKEVKVKASVNVTPIYITVFYSVLINTYLYMVHITMAQTC